MDYDELTYPALDSKRLGVAGSSYGEFGLSVIPINYLCSGTISIANWISKVMTADTRCFSNTTQLGAAPWRNA